MSHLFDLKGKVAVITGASSGLGVQFAHALANQGADVALVARRVDKLESVKTDIEKLGVKALVVACDVSAPANVTNAVAQILEHFGKVDILVNNAGTANAAKAEEQTDEQWESVMDINVGGVYYFCREVGKNMIKNNYGKIINIGSIHSSVAMLGSPLSSYAASKGAVKMLTQALAVEWAQYNITVNAIGPGYFKSEMTAGLMSPQFDAVVKQRCPMGRMGNEGELDGAVVYLSSDASSYTTGQLLTVDGGWIAI